MDKSKICYKMFVGISALLGFSALVVFLRLTMGFEFPTERNLEGFLSRLLLILIITFLFSTSFCIILKIILLDMEQQLTKLNKRIRRLESK